VGPRRRAYHDFDANVIVAESNQGGDMIRYAINTVDPSVPVKLVHATRAKKTRAEPIVALFEQGRIHIVGKQTQLEDQLLTWDPEMTNSPDRLDAMVWGLHHLLGKGKVHHAAPPQGIGQKATNWSVFPIDTSQTGPDA
jgi:phage terminase large subunit-like protein